MNTPEDLLKYLIDHHENVIKNPDQSLRCFIGFDGFTDEIITAVKVRKNQEDYVPFTTITEFGNRILEAAEKSTNIEFIIKKKKLGGNGPILANALLEGGHRITYCGLIGINENEIELLFQELAARCERVITLGPSAHTDAIEFEDGKLMFGKHEQLRNVTVKNLLSKIDLESLTRILDESDLFVSANWTMLIETTDIWNIILNKVTPNFKLKKDNRWMYIDLADPAKRTDDDIKKAIHALSQLTGVYHTILGLNESEAVHLSQVLSLQHFGNSQSEIEQLAFNLQKSIGVSEIIIHTTHFALACQNETSTCVEGPYCPKPAITTGAGDNFNAGYCNALLYGLPLRDRLLCAVATSGYYVKNGKSPTMGELASFIREWKK